MHAQIVLATVEESDYLVHPPDIGLLAIVTYDLSSMDPLQAIKDAACEWVETTPEGARAYARLSDFNWGDALAEVPADLLAAHGIQSVQFINPRIVSVWHNDCILEEA